MIDIPWLALGLFSLVLLIPISLLKSMGIHLGKELIISIARMTIQLILVGFYLTYLFELNSLTVNVLWLVVMTVVASYSIRSKAKLSSTTVLVAILLGLFTGLLPMLAIILAGVVNAAPLYDARYLIPLAGMLLGNCLSANIVSLQNFTTSLEDNRDQYYAAIALGASPLFATQHFIQQAVNKSIVPSLASMSTMGIVTLPGMMTGQILGGADPIVAIKYQLMIMIAIFTLITLSSAVTLKIIGKTGFDDNGKILIH
ncbi:ABC transporter permease [Vibrio maerlii]|uniref:ABC transporter permease n=1 Tax=Vibrio maerlii TaxID=2231648 RepID=UPI000E3D32A5|nr:ABC transporter permease [Vibrio maerlii]